MVTTLSAPFIDRIKAWKKEWSLFYKTLKKPEKQAVRRYLDYIKKPDSEWSFHKHTEEYLSIANEKAYGFWCEHRAIQLKLF